MNTSSRFGDMVDSVRYWIEDHGVGLAMGGFLLIFGAFISWSISMSMEPRTYDARVSKLDSSEASTESGTSCNGDPVLLICTEEEVEVPAYYTVELTYTSPAADNHPDRGEVCRLSVSAEEFAGLEMDAVVPVVYRSWDGCAVKDWTLAAR